VLRADSCVNITLMHSYSVDYVIVDCSRYSTRAAPCRPQAHEAAAAMLRCLGSPLCRGISATATAPARPPCARRHLAIITAAEAVGILLCVPVFGEGTRSPRS
jgi:hypothetical protein